MRILHLLNYVNESGNGITNVAVDLAVEQARRGHQVWVASGGGRYEQLLSDAGVTTARLDFAHRRPLPMARTRAALGRLVEQVGPAVVHAHTLTPTVLARVLRHRPPLVATVHNEYQRGVWLMGGADLVVGVSEAVTRAMRRRGVPARRTRTVLNGTVGSPRRRTDLPPADLAGPAVVAIGAVSSRKGSDVLLDAFGLVLQQVPQAHLYLVGDCHWSEFAERVGALAWRDRVHLEGFVAQPQPYLAAADVFVLASRREPLGLVLLEALEAGRPIVGSDVDGIPEALDGGRAGLLVPVGAPAELADALVHLLQDREAAADLGRRARAFSAGFSVARMSQDYVDLYAAVGT